MANFNKNKRFGGDNFQPVRRTRVTGQDALERERQRKLERGHLKPLHDEEEDFFSAYNLDD
jgi:hypothetical protein